MASVLCTHVAQLLSKQCFRIQEASAVVYETSLQFSWDFSHICLSGRKIWNHPLDNRRDNNLRQLLQEALGTGVEDCTIHTSCSCFLERIATGALLNTFPCGRKSGCGTRRSLYRESNNMERVCKMIDWNVFTTTFHRVVLAFCKARKCSRIASCFHGF